MTCKQNCSQFDLAMELLIENGFDNVADVVGVLMNTAMQIERSRHLQAIPYERTEDRRGYANGYKSSWQLPKPGIANFTLKAWSVANDQSGL